MECHYVVVGSEIEYLEYSRKFYGVAVIAIYDEIPIVLETFNDISSDAGMIRKLVTACNDIQLDPIHFLDVLDDFLGDY